MSSWGFGTFEDDLACDWLEDLYESDPFAFFAHCLDLSDQEALTFIACVGVLCTGELLHLALVGPREKIPEAALVWADSDASAESEFSALLPSAVAGLDRVLASDSEMHTRWEDAGPELFGQWIDHVYSLRQALADQLVQSE